MIDPISKKHIGPVKLHLGCQEKYLEGYINIDLPPEAHTVREARVDVEADVRELDCPAGSVDEIRSHHLLEHFSRQEALLLLARWHKWLKIGGLLHVETPDFEESAKKFIAGNIDDQFQLARHIFGSHEASWAYHKDFWSENKFRYVLSELGYGDFRFEKISNNLEAKAPFLRGKVPAVGEKLLKNLGPLGFNALPNIVCYAKKIKKGLDYRAQIRRILEKSLVGRETKMLDVWMEEVEGKV
ncbi:MAG: class I SAM-dependent methyltransferase [Patescibacteria group bacterium]